ncbi:MAG: aminotransferase class III-fold pyridoxal phosphate-dependent enzyme [Planctomycetaceae bacterium]
MSQTITNAIESQFREKFRGSEALAKRAQNIFPNGVTHDGRFLKPFPPYIKSATGSRKTDVDGNELVDFWMGHGSLILGHSYPAMVEAVQKQAALGTHFGACHELELQWGEWVQKLIPSAERLRFTNSGTEATLMALRVARIVSGKSKIVKFAGHFHGWHDLLAPAAEPPHDTGVYSTPGVTSGTDSDLVIVPPNDLTAVAKAIDEHQPACVIVEATGGRWGVVPMRGEFLRGLRELTAKKNVILIFDEVITGFRVHPGGAQGEFGIRPDLTTLAKILAGGLPGGCLAGRADLLEAIAFDNPHGKKMKHPGTYNANPLSAAAGCAVLEAVATGEPCRLANERARELRRAFNDVFEQKDLNWVAYGDFSSVKIIPEYNGPRPDSDDFIPYDNDYKKLDRSYDQKLLHAFRAASMIGGVDFFGWGAMVSACHTPEDIALAASAVAQAIDLLRADGYLT